MIELRELLLSLLDTVPLAAGGADAGVVVAVDAVELAVPVEARLRPGGSFQATIPRGRIATGFDLPHASMQVGFARRDGES